MAARHSLFDSLGKNEAWAEVLSPPKPNPLQPPKDRPMPNLLVLHRRCLTNLDDWGIRSVSEVHEDLNAGLDAVRNAMLRLEIHDLVCRQRRHGANGSEFWYLTPAGHIVADWLASGAEGTARAPRLPLKSESKMPTISQAIDMYVQGERGIKAIAKQIGIGHQLFSTLIKEAGFEVRPRGRTIQANGGQTDAPTET